MEVIKEKEKLKAVIRQFRQKDGNVGFVPTMGALHLGHVSLFERSKKENNLTVGSIFVNPIQFNNASDLEKYPRTIEKDLLLLENAGCDILFLPEVNEMYPQKPLLRFDFGELEKIMEGEFRPGHFNGVAIVVSKLFHLVQPDKAYFGLKDLQQFTIIRQMVKDLSFPLEVIGCSTLREKDGLAMSSRNMRLSGEKRKIAPKIKEALDLAASKIKSAEVSDIKKEIADFFLSNPDFQLEYFEIADYETLMPVKNVKKHKGIALCIAAWLDGVRLIDNVLIFS